MKEDKKIITLYCISPAIGPDGDQLEIGEKVEGTKKELTNLIISNRFTQDKGEVEAAQERAARREEEREAQGSSDSAALKKEIADLKAEAEKLREEAKQDIAKAKADLAEAQKQLAAAKGSTKK